MARRRDERDQQIRKAIINAREMMESLYRQDANEAETRRRIDRIFEQVLGYDAFEHLTREHAIRGAGETEHVDFAIQIETEDHGRRPVILVELKRVGVELRPKHLKQVASYAINTGCEWILLANGRQWRLHNVAFGKPPVTRLLHEWNLLEDEVDKLAQRFRLVSYRSVKSGRLQKVWETRRVLDSRNLVRAIFSERSTKALRRELRRSTGVLVSLEDIIGSVRRLLNENALAELEQMRITFPKANDGAGNRAAQKAARTRRTSLSDLIGAGVLPAPVDVYRKYKGQVVEAKVLPEGTIEFDGERYHNPSQAAAAARSAVLGRPANANGWTFWRYKDTLDHEHSLADARERYDDRQPQEPEE